MDYKHEQLVDMDVPMAKNGDGEAFGRLIHKNKHSMYRIAKSILKNEYDAEDAIGAAILHAYAKIYSLRKNENFSHWLLKILINECYAIIRKRTKEIYTSEFIAAQGTYEDKHNDDELTNSLNYLEDDQKIVVILFYYEDMSLKDISKTLHVPEGTVKSRLYRAKGKLRDILGNSI
ncbi:MAG: RNA polymerase subunit sigma-24 [Firmicutes bacterium HGW-Firmicutes-15]|nr:MAG: RNA polymerase subunit sigma-24 [Firmicutes bacterium HGW-Firmicutes-15]